jgi:hypothetical protein
VLDVGTTDLPGFTRMLEAFTAASPFALQPRGLPHATHAGLQGLPVAEAKSRADLADGFGWRRSAEALAGAT